VAWVLPSNQEHPVTGDPPAGAPASLRTESNPLLDG